MSTSSPAFAVGALLGALSVETSLQRELAAILEREHQLLTAPSHEELMKLEVQKEAVLERVRIQAQEVKTCMQALVQALSLPDTEAMSLTRLAGHLNEPDRTRLRGVQEALIALISSVKEQNRANDRLIHGALTYVTQFLNFMRSMVAGVPQYLPDGTIQELQQSGRLLALKG